MTISEHLTEQVKRLDLEHLTEQEHDWLHAVNTLFTWAYISKYKKEKLNHERSN